jgi:lipoic acid synthetase
VARWVEPDRFAWYRPVGQSLGIGHVEASPLTRSSYHARQAEAAATVGELQASPGAG